MATAAEKRRHARYPLVLAVAWPGGGPDGDRTEDVSDAGLFIRTTRRLQRGERLAVELSFPGLRARLPLTVEVVRVRQATAHRAAGAAVVVPADCPEEAARLAVLARAASGLAGSTRAFRVLLVEDNDLVANMYASALRRLSAREGLGGLHVESVGNGDRAWQRLGAAPAVDLVITDVYMPVMDGLKLLARIRAEPRLAALPVVVISSGAADEGLRAAELGAQLFLRKPVNYQDIVATVRTLLTASASPELRLALAGRASA
jgi:CheY-like chemotaxis protein/Tfp pilus assembly protein PilZ